MGIERMQEFWPEWKITEVLGEGSYGKVYKAVREEHSITTFCAIKVISVPNNQAEVEALHSEGMTDRESKEYLESVVSDFVNEIKLMEELKGTANTVSVEDYRILEKKDGKVGWDIFIRMELLESFAVRMSKGTVALEDVLKLGIDLCSALELCSKNNIIHRDIKPANIFISKNGDYKLGDFGVAKELGKTAGAMSAKGTYSYMAPEVANRKNYDSTVDIYSLGIVMYTLLNNNRQPFVDPKSPAVTYNERMAAANRRLKGEPLPPPANASKELSDIILTACAFDPAKRFRTAKAFKNALLGYKSRLAAGVSSAVPNIDVTVAVAHKAPEQNSVPRPPQPQRPTQPQSPVQPQRPVQQTPPKKKKKTGLIVAIIAVILVLAIALSVGAVFAIPAIIDYFDSSSSSTVSSRDDDDDDDKKDNDRETEEIPGAVDTEDVMDSYRPETDAPDTDAPDIDVPAYNDGEIYWEIDENGVLTITGRGALPDYETKDDVPWVDHRNNIKSIVISEGITRVGNYCFDNSFNCASISLPSTLKSIGLRAFGACSDVSNLTIPEGVVTIEESAFQSCWGVETLTVPSTVKTVEKYAFSFFDKLGTVYIYSTDAEWADNAFYDCCEGFEIYCYDGSTAETYASQKGFTYYTE